MCSVCPLTCAVTLIQPAVLTLPPLPRSPPLPFRFWFSAHWGTAMAQGARAQHQPLMQRVEHEPLVRMSTRGLLNALATHPEHAGAAHLGLAAHAPAGGAPIVAIEIDA